MSISRKYFFEIGIPCEKYFTISKSKDSRGCISSYSREFLEERFFSREFSIIVFRDDIGCLEEVSRTRIVAHTLIIREKLIIGCPSEMMDGRIGIENPRKISSYPLDLGLLEKYL
jgi:hypothetical protein